MQSQLVDVLKNLKANASRLSVKDEKLLSSKDNDP